MTFRLPPILAMTLLFSSNLLVPTIAQTIRINAGGDTYRDSEGNVWMKDEKYFVTENTRTHTSEAAIKETIDDTLYQTERWNPDGLSYGIPLPSNGDYNIRLHFSENFRGAQEEGARVFHVVVEDVMAMPNVDIFKEAGGGYTAMSKLAHTTVSGRSMKIDFIGVTQHPKVSAIEITKVANRGSAPIHPDVQAIIDVPGGVEPLGVLWMDSYSVGDECFCRTTYDHDIADVLVKTSVGWMTIMEACELLGPGPGFTPGSGYPIYNDIQCGNGPPNNAGDEHLCPGRVDLGEEGCGHIGPTWKFN